MTVEDEWTKTKGRENYRGLREPETELWSFARYRAMGVTGKSGSEAAALQIAASKYYAGLSKRKNDPPLCKKQKLCKK